MPSDPSSNLVFSDDEDDLVTLTSDDSGTDDAFFEGISRMRNLATLIQFLKLRIKCPLSGGMILNAVVGSDGWTYEQSAIEHWCETKSTSPITREGGFYMIGPNRVFQEMLDEYQHMVHEFLNLHVSLTSR